MTISSLINRAAFTGNGVTVSFSFPYPFLVSADLKVYLAGVLQTITTHYTISGSAPYTAGANVVFVTAPAAAASVVILRDPALTQAVNLVEGDPLPVEASVETPLDKLTLICQRLKDRLDRAVVLDDTDVTGATPALPAPTANLLLGWNSAGTALENKAAANVSLTIVSAFINTLLDDTNAAAALLTLGAAALASPTFTGTPAAPTAAADTNTTQLASTAFVLAQAASQAELEAGTSVSKFVTAGRAQYLQGMTKAWVKAGVTANIIASYGVASLTDQGTGLVRTTWTTGFSSNNYPPIGSAMYAGGAIRDVICLNGIAASADWRCNTGADVASDPDFWCIAAYGDQ